jgi:Spy/CpxP family protein refolding chaperone
MSLHKNRSVSRLLSPVIMFCFFSTSLLADKIPDPDVSQKTAIDKMHHKLHDDQALFKEKEVQALKELNEMTIRDDVKLENIHAKIDALMAAKTQIMRLRYEHLIEMRAILTDAQKVTYDKNVLNRSAVK